MSALNVLELLVAREFDREGGDRGATNFRDALGTLPNSLAGFLGTAPNSLAVNLDTHLYRFAGLLGTAHDSLAGFVGATHESLAISPCDALDKLAGFGGAAHDSLAVNPSDALDSLAGLFSATPGSLADNFGDATDIAVFLRRAADLFYCLAGLICAALRAADMATPAVCLGCDVDRLANGLFARRRQLVPPHLRRHYDLVQSAVVGDRHVLLNFVELHEKAGRDRVFLGVDRLVLERVVSLAEWHADVGATLVGVAHFRDQYCA